MSVILPKIVAIDTGLLSDLTRDANSSNRRRVANATATIELLNKSELVPLITFEHILELIQHADDKTVEARVDVLRGLACVATPRHVQGFDGLGSVLDLDAAEVLAIYIKRKRSIQEVLAEVRSNAFVTGTSRDLLRAIKAVLPELRDRARARRPRSSQIASISHAEFHRHGDKKISKFKAHAGPEAPPTADEIKWLVDTLTEQLSQRGERGLPDARALAESFSVDTARQYAELGQHRDLSLISAMCRQFGVDERAVNDDLTLTDFGWMATYQAQLGVLVERARLPTSLSEYDVPSRLRPAWVVRKALDDRRRRGMRADGSDLIDSMLAGLCCYADVTVVDVRTKEFLAQAQRSQPILVELMRTVTTLSTYCELSEVAQQ